MNRRDILLTGPITLLLVKTSMCCARADTRLPHSKGCLLANADAPAVFPEGSKTTAVVRGEDLIFEHSEDRNFDRALAQTLAKIAKAFEVLPGFGYYDDAQSLNAYATPIKRMNNVDGTVLMGREFLKWMKQRPEYPEVAIAGVCAHEFGHILQFKHGLIPKVNAGQSTVKRSELQADFFAGYFAGLRKLEKPNFPAAVVALAMHDVGDNDYTNEQHHGTPEERGKAVVRGFETALVDNKSLGDAINISTTYVMSL